MDYNEFEMKTLNRIKNTPYKFLEDWEKFFIKENVYLHRRAKQLELNERLFHTSDIDYIEGAMGFPKQKRTKESNAS